MSNELRNKYDVFIYDNYKVEQNAQGIKVTYNYKISEYEFNPTINIDNKFIINENINNEFLDYLFFNFGIINAINYYKLTCAKKMIINAGYLDETQKEFFKKLFYNGLSEFLYVNNLDLSYDEFLTIETKDGKNNNYVLSDRFNGNLIPIGGGKDSVVTVEKLKGYDNLCFLYRRNIYPDDLAALNTIKLSGNDYVTFDVTLDPLMLSLNKEGFLNGHIPFSSCLAFASFIMAYLTNKKYIALSNEASANESNIKNTNINHQYSKSYEFEKDFREYTSKYFTNKIEYFSLLRCYNEFQIVKEFLKYPKYLEVFRSCNRGSKTNSWCSDCSKCLYVFIMLYPHLKDEELLKIFNCNMLDKEEYKDMFLGLISDKENKPFECVGTKEEINYALTLSLKKSDKLPCLLKFYKDNIYDEKRKYNIENYYNEKNFIPKEYLINKNIKEKIIEFLENKKILIIGYGREGKSAHQFIKDNLNKYELGIADKNEIKLDNIKTYHGDDYLDATKYYDIVIKSPGVIIKDYINEKEKNKITSLTDLFLRFCSNKVIGITGTKGKSTTSSLIYHILKENNYDTYLIGNIGIPCFDVLDKIKQDTILVYELSCHQLEYVKKSPTISILLNLYEEHLDHYIDINAYINSKKNIYKFQNSKDYFIYGDINKYMTKEELNGIRSNKICIYDSDIDLNEVKTSLIGEHNKYNIITAVIASELVGVKKEKALKAVQTFKGLEHRLEYVGKYKNIEFYNDSIATAQEAVINAVKSLKHVNTIIIGGMDRGLDYSILVNYLRNSNVENIVLLPSTNERIKELFGKNTIKRLICVKDMEEAVKMSYKYTKDNEICLLSPAAASYGFYLNFEKRGEHFKELVKEYSK